MAQATPVDRTKVSFEQSGSGPPLLLIHGSLNNAMTAWFAVKPMLEQNFTVYAMDRRGRRDTPENGDRTIEAEALDVVAVLQEIREPAFVFAHSYGAICALVAALAVPEAIRKLSLYEPPRTDVTGPDLAPVIEIGESGDWEAMVTKFITEAVRVPTQQFEMLRNSPMFQPLVDDGKASLGDFKAMRAFAFEPEQFSDLKMPVQLLVGADNPRPEMYMTGALKSAIPDVTVTELPGQAHVAHLMNPAQVADKVTTFLLD